MFTSNLIINMPIFIINVKYCIYFAIFITQSQIFLVWKTWTMLLKQKINKQKSSVIFENMCVLELILSVLSHNKYALRQSNFFFFAKKCNMFLTALDFVTHLRFAFL